MASPSAMPAGRRPCADSRRHSPVRQERAKKTGLNGPVGRRKGRVSVAAAAEATIAVADV